MKYLKDLDVKNKRVLIRADFNVPLDSSQKITDDNRIKQFLPTLQEVVKGEGRPIIMSHLGSPSGKPDPALSLKPIADHLAKITQMEAVFSPACIGPEPLSLTESLKGGQVLLLENLRFHPGETKNDPEFAKQLAQLGDVYVSDAFATAHRAHASIVSTPQHFKEKACGLLMEKELQFFEKALVNPKRPLCVILGGAKISTKLEALINISDKADKLLIGGAMANTFLAAQGLQMGRSLYEAELFPKALELLGTLARRDCKVYLPVDAMVGPSPGATGLARAVPTQEIPADSMALDVGPATSLLFKEALTNAETIVWNGPMGAFENEDYSKGTTDLIEAIASSHALKVVGGGDTDAAIHHMQLAHKFTFISTGGGAFLALLEGKSLPGIKALE